MKKLIIPSIFLFLIISCSELEEPIIPSKSSTPRELTINNTSGIKLETTFVSTEVAINAKVEVAGKATIKIYDISNRVVSKEEVDVVIGDNILKVYTSILPSSAYRISLTDNNGKVLGIADFNKL